MKHNYGSVLPLNECNMLLFAELSVQGEKYLDKQIENAITGVKEMKSVMQKSSEDHQKFLDALEKTKHQKDVHNNTTIVILVLGVSTYARMREYFFV